MEDFKKRLIIEHKDLCVKIDKLKEYIDKLETLTNEDLLKVKEDYILLGQQLSYMQSYDICLIGRLFRLGVKI